jgi:dienelactone hydrolase
MFSRIAKYSLICFVLLSILLATVLPGAMAAAETGVAQPENPGPYHIGYYTALFYVEPYGIYTATIRYPAKYDGWLAPKDTSGSTYPGIAISDGSFGSRWMIDWIPQQLTSYGYVTICFTPPNTLSMDTQQWAQGFNKAIATLKSENTRCLSPMRWLLNTDKFGVVGYSMGGAGVIEAASANPDIDVVVALAPGADEGSLASYFEGTKLACALVSVPIQMQVGSNDGNVLPAWVDGYYNLIPATTAKEQLEITGGNHLGFFDADIADLFQIEILLGLDNPSTISVERQHEISRGYYTAWFQYYLKGITEYEAYILGSEAQNDLNTGVLTALEYNVP